MPHIAAGWESRSLKCKGTYASGMRNLALVKSAGDAPTRRSKKAVQLDLQCQGILATKWSPFAK